MRTMLILRGAPGSGKTSLVEELGLGDCALGFDMMREHFATTVPCSEGVGESTTWRLRPEDEKAVVTATYAALSARLSAGATVIFDATSVRAGFCKHLVSEARRYGYTPYVVDVQGETTLSELLRRNRERGQRKVDEAALEEMWQAGRTAGVPDGVAVVGGTAEAVEALLRSESDRYAPRLPAGRTVVVGDVHSCSQPLARAVADLDEPGTSWVFAGDLFDRGPDPVGVWRIVQRLIGEGRATVVTGNHESNLRAVVRSTATAPFADTRETRDALLAEGILAAEQAAFVDASVPAALIPSGSDLQRPWIVTHGGVGEQTAEHLLARDLTHVAEAECIYGLSDRGRAYRAKTTYDVGSIPLAGYQLHGHRAGAVGEEPVPPVRYTATGPVVCLEAGASAGGHVRVAVLTSSEPLPVLHEFADCVDVSRAQHYALAPWERKETPSLLERMRASEHVNVKPVTGLEGVVAANFTRQAFTEGAWDEVTMHARGLFLDEATGVVLARGYEKFFHVGEALGRDLTQWKDESATAYPVRAIKKYNGYLALVASIRGHLQVFSKSGITPYAEAADAMLTGAIGPQGREQLRGMLERTGTTAVFEVLRGDDPHPVAEPGSDRLVLLDAIRNQETFATDDAIARGIARRFAFEHAGDRILATAQAPDEMDDLLTVARSYPLEGVVLVDAAGYRSKVKGERYASRKSARTAIERVWRGRSGTLGQCHADLERRMRASGVWQRLLSGAFDVTGLDGATRLDLAGVFDALEETETSR